MDVWLIPKCILLLLEWNGKAITEQAKGVLMGAPQPQELDGVLLKSRVSRAAKTNICRLVTFERAPAPFNTQPILKGCAPKERLKRRELTNVLVEVLNSAFRTRKQTSD